MDLKKLKKCNKCGEEKELKFFSKSKNGKFGVRGSCKICEREKYKKWAKGKGKECVKQINNRYYQREKFSNKYRFIRYKASAKQRGFDFNINKEECFKLFNGICYYCGDKDSRIGIDRIDSDKGYITGNIVPCCKRCNIMKNKTPLEDFINHCEKIVKCYYTKHKE